MYNHTGLLLHFKCDTNASDSWQQGHSPFVDFWKYDKTSTEDLLTTCLSTYVGVLSGCFCPFAWLVCLYELPISLTVCSHVQYVCQRVDEACTNCLNTITCGTGAQAHTYICTYIVWVLT